MRSVKFLWKYLLTAKKYIGLGILFTLLMSIFELFPGMIYKVIADSLAKLRTNPEFLNLKIPVKILNMKYKTFKYSVNDSENIFKVFLIICGLFLAVYILSGLFRYLRDIYFNFAIQKILKDIKDIICSKILNLPFHNFSSNRTGDLMSRVTYDVTILHNLIDVFIELSRSAITLLIFLPVLFYIDWQISLFAMLFYPLSVYLIKNFSIKMKKLSKGISDSAADYTEFLKDKIERIENVKIACKEEEELAGFKTITKNYYELAVKNIRIKYFLKPSNEVLGIFGVAIIAVYFCFLMLKGEMGAGNIVLYISVLRSAYKPFKKAAESIGDLHFSLAGADKITLLIDRDSEEKENEVSVASIDNIELSEVDLKIDGVNILNSIKVKFEKGNHYGITGVSGSGKTSLMYLLPGLYKNTHGKIFFNGTSVKDIDILTIRKKISFVGSSVITMNGTIFENITYGLSDAEGSYKMISEKISLGNFLNISNFSKDMIVGKDGIKLSTGQAQKVALINAVLREPDLFIIDEGLDLLSREDIEQFLSLIRENSILLIVSRQKFILDKMDKIYTMFDGTIE